MTEEQRQTDSVYSVVGSWSNVSRAITLFLGLIAVLVVSAIVIYHHITKSSDVTITFTNKGGVVFQTLDTRMGSFLLPASAGWVNTGFTINPGERVRIQSFGRVHLSMGRLLRDSKNNRVARGWSSPDGFPYTEDILRKSLLVAPDANKGMLLGYLGAADYGDEIKPSKDNPRPGKILKLGGDKTFRNTTKETQELWLTVNDYYLNKEAEKAYFSGEDARQQLKDGTDRASWEYIVKNEYWELWFDDNLGEYLINISFIKD